jgi:hypothetical protein
MAALVLGVGSLAAALVAGPSAIQREIRPDSAPLLDDVPDMEARGFARLSNPARGYVDAPMRRGGEMGPRRQEGEIPADMNTSFEPTDILFRHLIPRQNLRGDTVSRFLRMVIQVNCGQDAALVESLNQMEGRILNDVLEDLVGNLTFENLRHPSQKNDLREQMIIAFNKELETTSIQDIYFDTFVVY